ncbi:MAG: N-acetylmuramoyl-L-alanine amidase [Paracoccaceae bacterium]|nr:N-acetylmuramoyl-L-alanine amidase [Paracoccaceae bacterium]
MPGPGRLTHPSPNFGDRRHGGSPRLVVLHYTGMATAEDAVDRLRDPATEVSAHYLISETGALYSLVRETKRAWHAGVGRWGGITDINSNSIGIELANSGSDGGFPPFPEPQVAVLEDLLAGILFRWNLGPEHVIGHSDMAPGRKPDPGPAFDWRRLAHSELSIWPSDEPTGLPGRSAAGPGANRVDVNVAFRSAASAFGYSPMTDDNDGWRHVLVAFRTRFRTGPLVTAGAVATPAALDIVAARDLAFRYPVRKPGG